jgi:hypothetical protein
MKLDESFLFWTLTFSNPYQNTLGGLYKSFKEKVCMKMRALEIFETFQALCESLNTNTNLVFHRSSYREQFFCTNTSLARFHMINHAFTFQLVVCFSCGNWVSHLFGHWLRNYGMFLFLIGWGQHELFVIWETIPRSRVFWLWRITCNHWHRKLYFVSHKNNV